MNPQRRKLAGWVAVLRGRRNIQCDAFVGQHVDHQPVGLEAQVLLPAADGLTHHAVRFGVQ